MKLIALLTIVLASSSGQVLGQAQQPAPGQEPGRFSGIERHVFTYSQSLNGGHTATDSFSIALPRFDPARGTLLAVSTEVSSSFFGTWTATNNTNQPVDSQVQAFSRLAAPNIGVATPLQIQPISLPPQGSVGGSSEGAHSDTRLRTDAPGLAFFTGATPLPQDVDLYFSINKLGPAHISVSPFGTAIHRLRVTYMYQ